MSTMYPGKANSPTTELASAITASADTITVLNGNALPDAPNLATIGEGEIAETVRYTAKSGNVLSGVERGFDGTVAASWTAGTKLARNFTNYDYEAIRKRLEESASIPKQLTPGANIIETTQATPATVEFKGRSLVNIPGKDGGCESLAPFAGAGSGSVSLDSNIKRSGSSIKFSTNNQSRHLYKDYDYTLDKTKNYVLSAWVYIESWVSGAIDISLRDYNTLSSRYASTANTSLIGQWQLVTFKIPKSNTLVGNGFRLLFGQVTTGTAVHYVDEIRLYEVSDADFTAIGTTIVGGDIDRYFPYVDSVQHAQGLSLRAIGKNIILPFTELATRAEETILEPYKIKLTNPSISPLSMDITVSVTAGQRYTLSAVLSNKARLQVRNSAGAQLAYLLGNAASDRQNVSFTPTEGTVIIRRYNDNAAGDFIFENLQLELGSVATPFQPRQDQYINAPMLLASNPNGSIADSYDSATGKVFRRLKKGVKLGGLLTYRVHSAGYTGFKRIESTLQEALPQDDTQIVVRFDGNLLGNTRNPASSWPGPDYARITNESGTVIRLSVAHTVSGWIDSVDPNPNAIKALMNGWKANGNNGTVYNSWASILTGAAPATNTEAYVAANKAPGWDCYATLDYVLATPVTEDISGDLGGIALPSGSSQVELIDGVIVREKVKPALIGSFWYVGAGTAKLNNRSENILRVDSEASTDSSWTKTTRPSTDSAYPTHGAGYAQIPQAQHDGSDVYVTYRVLDRYKYTAGIRQATVTYQSSPGAVIAKNAQNIAELQRKDGVQDFALDYIQAMAQNNAVDVAAHTADNAAHGATSTPTANKIAMYGAGGRLKASEPVDPNDVARKAEIDDLKSSVSDGKATVAAAITGKGVPTAADATFQILADNILKVTDATISRVTGVTFVGNVSTNGSTVIHSEIFSNLPFRPKIAMLNGQVDWNGSIQTKVSTYTVVNPNGFGGSSTWRTPAGQVFEIFINLRNVTDSGCEVAVYGNGGDSNLRPVTGSFVSIAVVG